VPELVDRRVIVRGPPHGMAALRPPVTPTENSASTAPCPSRRLKLLPSLMVTDGEELLSTVVLCDPGGYLDIGKHVRKDSDSIPTLAIVGQEPLKPKRKRPRNR
jgi:hypothetical protein